MDIAVAIPMSLIVIGLASAVGAVPKVRAGQLQRWFAYLAFAVADYVVIDTLVLR